MVFLFNLLRNVHYTEPESSYPYFSQTWDLGDKHCRVRRDTKYILNMPVKLGWFGLSTLLTKDETVMATDLLRIWQFQCQIISGSDKVIKRLINLFLKGKIRQLNHEYEETDSTHFIQSSHPLLYSKLSFFKIEIKIFLTHLHLVMLHRLYATSPLLNFRPTAISDLRQLFIFVLFEG